MVFGANGKEQNSPSYLNLTLHGNDEEGDEVKEKNWPKDWNIEYFKQ